MVKIGHEEYCLDATCIDELASAHERKPVIDGLGIGVETATLDEDRKLHSGTVGPEKAFPPRGVTSSRCGTSFDICNQQDG